MLIAMREVLDSATLENLVTALSNEDSAWVDGRATAGHQGDPVKRNLQLDLGSEIAVRLGAIILKALQNHAGFISATLPHRIFPPIFNRYDEGMHFGEHIDGAIRHDAASGRSLRADLSATVFLSHPQDYEGGELLINEGTQIPAVKLAAGSMILYPAGTRHCIEPIRRGRRLAAVFWIQSMVRDHGQRNQLLELDTAIQRLTSQAADQGALVMLTNHYHNLLRRWAEV
jgi:PKHD-type hydroxylase